MSRQHSMALIFPAFDAMQAGLKTAEGRGDKPTFQRIRKGDTIRFSRGYTSTVIHRQVVQVVRYPTFEEMVEKHHAELTATKTPEELLAFYQKTYPGLAGLLFKLKET